MTPEQFEQWRDFAERMAKTQYAKRQSPSLKDILSDIDTFFGEYNPNDVNDWMDITDYVSEIASSNVWQRTSAYASERQRKLLDGYWDSNKLDKYDELKEKICDQYERLLHCCIRTGLDIITDDFGVLGFTANDIRAMYPEGVPNWIKNRFKDFDSIPDCAELPL